ncbi:adhesive plaque matrix protein-like isoform X2 [Daphnia pulicaria]|uniref:adhesive plaque matrix protein-like isoform X2 n=1 Tax=Daphnia pulicaria TaxID=35523 RepID=UPI001EEB41C9|nr:adhesive plaque matrix protein-like isoform X2 [Daphnia pulicaria]
MKVFCILATIIVLSDAAAQRESKRELKRVAPRQAPYDPEYYPESTGYGMPYQFGYSVYHPQSYNDYGHQEKSDGKRVDGEYRVALPDGRTQIVTYYVEGNSGFQAKVRYEPTVANPPPITPSSRPYEGPEPPYVPKKPVYAPEPVYEPRKPVYAPEPSYESRKPEYTREPTYEPRKPFYPPPQEPAYVPKEPVYEPRPVYRPREPEYPSGHLIKKPLYEPNPFYSSTDKPSIEQHQEPFISTISPPVTDEPKSSPPPSPASEVRKPHDGYSPNPYTKPYPPNDYPTTQTPYPQTYVPYAPREYPKPHDGYSDRLYKQFQGDYGRKVQPHDGYTPKQYNEPKEEHVPVPPTSLPHDIYSHKKYNERKEEYTPNLPHDGYSPRLYNQPKEEYAPKPYTRPHEGYAPKQYPQEENPAQEVYTPRPYQPEEHSSGRPVPHSGYGESNYRASEPRYLEKYRPRPNYPRPHDGYSTESYPRRELNKQGVESGERKPHSGYSDNEVVELRRPASEKRRRSPPKRVVRQRYVPITRRNSRKITKEVKGSQASPSQVSVTTVQPSQLTTNRQ